jgi:lipooligosaccharide transport system permease protein
MGVGVGTLVDQQPSSADVLGGVDYFAFLAPALIVTTVMMTLAQEAMWPVLDGFLWSNAFRSMYATPLDPGQITAGVALWQATRALMTGAGVAMTLLFFDDTRSWGLIPAVAFAVMTGLAISLPLTAWSASRDVEDTSFPAIMRFGIMPMFLFAGAFFPIDQLPGWLQVVARMTPLYHGVELSRGAVLGTLTLSNALGHVAVLVAFAAVGYVISRHYFARRLTT